MSNKKLTIEQANDIADGLVIVSVDPVDAELWRVEDADAAEAHEPMAEAEWREFLAEWASPADKPADNTLRDTFERIAREELDITTLETRGDNEQDFHRLAAWEIETVMERAYQAGVDDASKGASDGPKNTTILAAILRECISPQAAAAIAAYIQPVRTMDPEVIRQVRWFQELLTTMVGGADELNRLCDEIGL